jgi:uncharacterized membrane protein YgaE (UPF0421/DUF939 family)
MIAAARRVQTKRLAAWDIAYAIDMAIACWLSFAVAAWAIGLFANTPNDLLGGTWATIATIFVFRDTRIHSWSAGLDRLTASTVSFALCLPYLLLFPSTPFALGLLIGTGTLVMMLLDRREDIGLTAITTAVVMVVAIISPEHAWQQPLLRFADTAMGIAIGISCRWLAAYAFSRITGQTAQ